MLLREPLAARVLGVPVSRLRFWRRNGGGPEWVRLGERSVRYRTQDLETFMAHLSGANVVT
jgi:hypothetical protein